MSFHVVGPRAKKLLDDSRRWSSRRAISRALSCCDRPSSGRTAQDPDPAVACDDVCGRRVQGQRRPEAISAVGVIFPGPASCEPGRRWRRLASWQAANGQHCGHGSAGACVLGYGGGEGSAYHAVRVLGILRGEHLLPLAGDENTAVCPGRDDEITDSVPPLRRVVPSQIAATRPFQPRPSSNCPFLT